MLYEIIHWLAWRVGWLAVAGALHVGLVVAFQGLERKPVSRKRRVVQVRVMKSVRRPEVELAKKKPILRKMEPKVRRTRVRRKKKRVLRPPLPPQPSPVVSKKVQSSPPPRVVGLSMASTVKGAGPTFVVGHTLEGVTDKVGVRLQKPRTVKKEQRAAPLGLTRPKRLKRVEPLYPEELRGIEAEVMVQVRLTKTGSVRMVRIIRPSTYEAFNQAAIDAAQREKFSPAISAGEPIEYTIRFTYRFRTRE